MKMQEPHQLLPIDEDETLVTPRFDDEETVVARRVVPLESVAHDRPAAPPPSKALARPIMRLRFAPRRTWALALVAASTLVGGVLGGAGLYFYQSRASAHATPAAAQPQSNVTTSAPATLPQPTPAPTAEVVNDQAIAPSDSKDSEVRTDGADGAKAEERAVPKDSANAPEAEQRKASDEGEQGGSPKRGKKGAHDEEVRREGRRAKRSDADGELSRANTDDSADDNGEPVARHVDTLIFERPRRAARRDHARHEADRLRRIFEGQP
jgi:hypothetical protein